MVPLPTVKSFCGCCDLRVVCIAFASFRMIMSVLSVLSFILSVSLPFLGRLFGYSAYSGMYSFNRETAMRLYGDNYKIVMVVYVVCFMIYMAIVFKSISSSYNFILGAISDDPEKMKSYLIVQGITIVVYLLLLLIHVIFIILAVFEFYVLICSNSVYRQSLHASQVNELNETDSHGKRFYNNVPLYVDAQPQSASINMGRI